jgi:mono/diheme cytochrome c family protein
MNLVRLRENAPNTFGFICAACHKFRDSKLGGYADLDGPSFKTFYCKECGDAQTNEAQMPRVSADAPAASDPHSH